MSLPPSFFEHLSDRLELAVYDTNQEHRMSVHDIAQALSDEPIPATVPASPFVTAEKPTMSITGLQSGAFQAKLAEMRQKIADSQAKGLAKIDAAVTAGAAELDAAADGAAAKANKEIANALQEFGLTTNGGPE